MTTKRTTTETATTGRTGQLPTPRRPTDRPLNDGTRGLLGKHEHPHDALRRPVAAGPVLSTTRPGVPTQR